MRSEFIRRTTALEQFKHNFCPRIFSNSSKNIKMAAEHLLNHVGALIPLQEIVPGEARILTKFVEDHFVPELFDFKHLDCVYQRGGVKLAYLLHEAFINCSSSSFSQLEMETIIMKDAFPEKA